MYVYIYNSYSDKNVTAYEVISAWLFWTFGPYTNNGHPSFYILFYSPVAPQAYVNQLEVLVFS